MLWSQTETIKVERNRFDRKVREALEIQYHKCNPKHMGQYVKTIFRTLFFTHLQKTSEKNTDISTIAIKWNQYNANKDTLALTN